VVNIYAPIWKFAVEVYAMNPSRVLPVVLSILVIIFVAVIQERSRYLAAIVATMPVSAPLALWIVYTANRDQPERVAGFALSMVGGLVATGAFAVACWVALRQRLPLGAVLLAGYAAWGMVALLVRWLFPALG
jgi:uncharacterized membrane protein (GlpM family)